MTRKYQFNLFGLFVMAIVSLFLMEGLSAASLAVPNTYVAQQSLTASSLNDNFTEVETQVTNNDSRITSKENQLQNLVAGCNTGTYIRAIDSSGIVSCEANKDELANLTCSAQQIPKYDGSQWICSNDVDTTYSAGSGVSISNGVISASVADTLSGLGCTTDQVAKYNGTQWVCATDANTVNVESGIDYSAYETVATTHVNVGTTIVEVDRVVLSAPSAGFVIVNFSSFYRLNHITANPSTLEIDINNSATPALDIGSKRFVGLSPAAPSFDFYAPFSMHKIFPIAANSSITFVVYAVSSDPLAAGSIRISNPQTYALFVPNLM